jgi:outer membrane protein assembly factor BamB
MATSVVMVGCSVFIPMEGPTYPPLVLDWSQPLYDLEPFPYHPRDEGRATFLKGTMTPDEGLVVVPSKDRLVRGFEAHTGRLLWEATTLGPNVAAPVVVGEDLLIASLDGHVYRLHQRNGRVVWDSGSLGKGALYREPVVAEDRVFVTGDDDRVTALSLSDGARLWERDRPVLRSTSVVSRVTGQAGVAVAGGKVYTGFSDGRLMAFDVSDGATLWTLDLSGGGTDFVDVDSTPVLTQGGLLIASAYATGLHGVDAATGEVAWRLPGEGFGESVLYEGTLYVTRTRRPAGQEEENQRNAANVLAVDAATGDVRWTLSVGETTPCRPAVSSKYLLVPVNSALLVVDRGTGRALRQYDDTYGFSATPAVAWGTVYALANSGIMYAFGLY